MSVSTVDIVLKRLESAEPESPLAIFEMHGHPGKFNVVFANTVESIRQIKKNPPYLVGVFDKTHDKDDVRHELNKRTRKNRSLS